MTPSNKKSTTEKTILITRRDCRAVPAICELRGLLLGCCKQVRMYCGSETVDRTDRSNRRMQHDPDRRCSTFLREVNRCVFRPTGTWRTILPNFIQIRFETTEPWAFLKSVAPTRRTRTRWVAIWDQFQIKNLSQLHSHVFCGHCLSGQLKTHFLPCPDILMRRTQWIKLLSTLRFS